MHIIVLGAGIVGVSSAYYLSKAGFQVTVIDRQPGVALETSFANAGQITPALTSPWAAPGIPLKAMKWMFQQHSPLAIKLTPLKFQYEWMLKMLSNCQPEAYAVNKERMVRIARHSQSCFEQIQQEFDFHYDERRLGTLQIFRDESQLEAAAKIAEFLNQEGFPCQLLRSKAEVLQVERGLSQAEADIVGGLYLKSDQTGDCYKFTVKLAELCQKMGVVFRFNSKVKKILSDGNNIKGILLDQDVILEADQYVVALGSYSRDLLKTLSISIPVYPLKGYSITTDITAPDLAPTSTILDDHYKVAITCLNDRIRVGGMAELCGFDRSLNPQREETLKMVLNQLFPKGSDMTQTKFWTGFRPTTPDGTPIIGKTRFKNLFTNTGHGTFGWTMSCGSGQILSDLILGQPTKVYSEDLNYYRYA